MMITIYHLGASQSDRIVWLMEELNLPYKLEWFDRGAGIPLLTPSGYIANYSRRRSAYGGVCGDC